MGEISRLRLMEAARVDRNRLECMVHDYGAQGAERLMGRALEDLAVRLNRVERYWAKGDFDRLGPSAEGVADVAGQVGLTGLSKVALAVTEVSLYGDPVAAAACVSRLMRVGEASLLSAWDLQDLTI